MLCYEFMMMQPEFSELVAEVVALVCADNPFTWRNFSASFTGHWRRSRASTRSARTLERVSKAHAVLECPCMLHHASLLASCRGSGVGQDTTGARIPSSCRHSTTRGRDPNVPGGVYADSTLRSVVQAASDSFPSTSRIGGLPAPREVDLIVEQELADHPAPAQVLDVDAEEADRHVPASRRPSRTPKAARPHPRSCAVIDVDSLSGWDIAFVDRGRSVSSPYDSDPPWSEICDEVPWISAFSEQAFTVPSLGTSLPASAAELHENMVHYILSSSSPALLQRMLSYHAAFSTLHSTASFNILIRLAIRMSSYGTVPFLLEKMRLERIPGNSDTRALRVRWMVRTGKWDQAWNDERKVAEDEGVAMPLSVWLEFFEIAKRGTIWRPVKDLDDPTSHRKRLDALEDSVAPGRYRVLFMNPLPLRCKNG
ncbi:hypothetical protein A0H81_00818 [Grifola frondosa]|uniref:Uncharacterized protein n=1 Tax=Grifola frondosa TaxID=5627 RepID=A0A1C7MP87_GRIFR|nr:hypothetical protein A0H81_00818 [Grifola frondosa]